MSDKNTLQSRQDNEYSFPYHYVTRFNNDGFRHFFLDTWAINYASTLEFLLEKISDGAMLNLVDIGCGDGRFTRELAVKYPNASVVGIDYSKRAIALAVAMNPDVDNIRFMSVDITQQHDLPQFDVAILMEVFEHIPLDQAENFLKAVRGLMHKDGVLYLTVPHANKPVEYKHFQHFTVAEIERYLSPYFNIVESISFEKIGWSRKVLNVILSNRYVILNNSRLLKLAYQWYKKHLFLCSSERECQRIFIKARAK